MKISELIAELQRSLDNGGDLTVMIASDEEGSYLNEVDPQLSIDFIDGPICDCCEADGGNQAVVVYPIG